MSKFYTRGGDDGFTGRLGEGRVAKQDALIELLGTIDEASAAIGLARAMAKAGISRQVLLQVQRDLYHLMAEVSATPENAARFRKIDRGRVNWLEAQTDQISGAVNLPNEFIIPGDTQAGAAIALARTIVRRAERRLAGAVDDGGIENMDLLPYLNRLSSLCFVLELLENQAAGASQLTLAKKESNQTP
jgi:cob(I)alamin adenosyltransferase